MKKNYFLKCHALLLATFLFSPFILSCQNKKFNLPEENLVIEKSDGSKISVNAEVAVKAAERNYGYMKRKKIPEGTGMLFVFEQDQILSFWMKDTPTPLTIAYIDSFGRITDLLDMQPFDLSSIQSSRSVRFALEVPQGWYKKMGVSIGDKVFVEKADKSEISLKEFFFD